MGDWNCVYVVGRALSDEDCEPPTKVGFSGGDPYNRLAVLQTSCPFKIGLFRSYSFKTKQQGRALERELHRILAPYRLYGEWFDFEPALISEAIDELIGL